MYAHLPLGELQSYNSLLNNWSQENFGSDHKKISHIQGQRRSSSKMVGEAKSHLESNTTPARDAQRAQTTLCIPGVPTESQPDMPLSAWASPVEVWVSGSLLQGKGLWVQQTWVWHKPSWRRSPLTHQRGTRTYTGLGDRHLEGTNRMLWAPGPRRKQQWPFNYKLAVTKSIASDWTAKAFAVSFYGDWAPRCSSCWPSTISEGVQGGGRHSVLQGIWWAGV